jgi:hypothetical protein
MKSEDSFIDREFPQNCGDSLLVLEKTKERVFRNKGKGDFLYKGIFKKYPCEVIFNKGNLLKGQVNNPQIEQKEFVEKLWPQNCGDILKVTNETNGILGAYKKWKCISQKYGNEIWAYKNHIINGKVNNPLIEEKEFIGKVYTQSCNGHFSKLKVLRKSEEKENGHFLYEYIFLDEGRYFGIARKGDIINGQVDNKGLIWKSEFKLRNYLEHYKSKPSVLQISKDLEVNYSEILSCIHKFNLENFIHWNCSDREEEVREYCLSINNSFLLKATCKELKNNYEIDIYSPKLKLGFEFNGDYWHSDEVIFKTSKGKFKTSKEKDKFKYNLAKEKGIDLYFIKEEDWLNNKEEVKERIKHIIYEHTR